ncbi:rolling circle replication-associated protein, partial [Bifidobacterium hominis]|uniref:rolling circle replication-associated protein n=1 Tax=Bifidobacterium hominis TaxID=3133177 RepID=UPI003D07DD60
MPVVSLYPNGTSASVLSGLAPAIAPRGAAQGWTPGAARRNDHFLQSIDFGSLSGEPWALTLTIPSADAGKGHVPDSAEFHAMLQAMVKRLRRLGATRWHWVIEMTRRKTPHVHLSVWFSEAAPDRELRIRI